MFKLILILCASFTQLLHGFEETPWTPICRHALWCNLIAGDITREMGQFKKIYYENAARIGDEYLRNATGIDQDEVEDILSEEGINLKNPHGTTGRTNFMRLQKSLDPYGLKIIKEDPTSPYEPMIEYKNTYDCQDLLDECESNIDKLVAPSSKPCRWETYAYMWFKCSTINDWPNEIKNFLLPSEMECGSLPECPEFIEWENEGDELPDDWEERKKAASAVVTGPTGRINLNNNQLLEIIKKNPNKIISAPLNQQFAYNYTPWETCPPNTYVIHIRIRPAVVGIGGFTLICGRLKRSDKSIYSPIAIFDETEDGYDNPQLNCDDGLVNGFWVSHYREGNWRTFIQGIGGICNEIKTKQLPPQQQLNTNGIVNNVYKCGNGEAVCGWSAALDKPYLRGYKRIYGIKFYCCKINYECDPSEEYEEIYKWDRSNQHNQIEKPITLNVGFEKSGPILNLGLSNQQIGDGLQKMFTTDLKPGLLDWNQVQDWNPTKSTKFNLNPLPHYDSHVYIVKGTCGHYVYYPPQIPIIVPRISIKSCAPIIRNEYVDVLENSKNNYNLSIGTVYDLPQVQDLKYDTHLNITDGLDEKFQSIGFDTEDLLKINITALEFRPKTWWSIIGHQIAICGNKHGVEEIRVQTRKVIEQPLVMPSPFWKRANSSDTLIKIAEYSNLDEPDGAEIIYELVKIGIDFPGNNINIPPDVRLPKLTYQVTSWMEKWIGKSPRTGYQWKTNNEWAVVGQYKITRNITVNYMETVIIYQIVGWLHPQGHHVYISNDYHQIIDADGNCIGGTLDCQLTNSRINSNISNGGRRKKIEEEGGDDDNIEEEEMDDDDDE